MATGPKVPTRDEIEEKRKNTPDFRTKFETVETAGIVYPLSEEVDVLLAAHGLRPESEYDNSQDAEKGLIAALKSVLWASPKLWEFPPGASSINAPRASSQRSFPQTQTSHSTPPCSTSRSTHPTFLPRDPIASSPLETIASCS